jgi:predicted nucleic acid-binding protein
MTAAALAFDTSAAVPLLMATHPFHEAIARWSRGKRLALTAHSCAETYSVITRWPGDARLTAAAAAELLDRRFPEVVTLPAAVASSAHRRLAERSITGGAVYDGLVALAALENGVALVSRDQRARPTYDALGAHVVVPAVPPTP